MLNQTLSSPSAFQSRLPLPEYITPVALTRGAGDDSITCRRGVLNRRGVLCATSYIYSTRKLYSDSLSTTPERMKAVPALLGPHRPQDIVALVQLVHGENTTDHVVLPHEVEQLGRNLFRAVPH